MTNTRGAWYQCPKCGHKQISFALLSVRCQGCPCRYKTKGRQTTAPENVGTMDFIRAAQMARGTTPWFRKKEEEQA